MFVIKKKITFVFLVDLCHCVVFVIKKKSTFVFWLIYVTVLCL